jgi:hypothetical protein
MACKNGKDFLSKYLINYVVACRFASHVLLFQDALIFRSAIALCYNWQIVAL